ncbi:Cu/Ag efflux protein CusF [Variovorax sp. TBS-050B]|uniref:hypothetical protein n=1 Tax=Variovorax sp. TBS-050B TaxID=2940551 RepID=UPI002474E5B4|nr:hypothetical protein [Variovorax sp. TBS-050B]MDH6593626.1 Cu/Ag efflux protein CusF [Variovorax sp. TBS-050B]
MPFSPSHHLALAALGLSLIAGPAAAQPTPAPAAGETQPVYTRARFKSAHEEAGKPYVRLTLVPRAKLPFSTQTFRLADRALLDGIADDSPVEFVSRRIDGENTVVAIRAVPACRRFQKC